MIAKYSTGVWLIDLLAVIGAGFLVLLVVGLPVWAVRDSVRFRREDARELAAIPVKARKNTAEVTE